MLDRTFLAETSDVTVNVFFPYVVSNICLILSKHFVDINNNKESLRKYSVVPMVSRRVIQDLTLEEGPYLLPKGSTVMINIQALHLDPNIWPQPMRYDPTRFLLDHNNSSIKPDANSNATKADNGKSSDKSMANNGGSDPPRMNKTGMPIRPFTFLPFIAGPRNCLGQHLALLESKMVIALLTQRYTFHFCPDSGTSGNTKAARIDPEDWSDGKDPRHPFMVPLIPKKELLVIVTRKIVDSNLLHL